MPPQQNYCYLDEFGSFGFDLAKTDVSSHFIVGGPIVAEGACDRVTASLEEVAAQHFGGGIIKSKNVGADDDRRIRILRDMLALDFRIFALVVDKREIKDGPIRKYKRSFIKYLNSLAFQELYLAFPCLAIFADSIGDKEFMDGFVKYVERKHLQKDIFGNAAFGFQEDKSNRLTQLADFMVGTLARIYDATKRSPRAGEIMQLLQQGRKLLPVALWPKRPDHSFQSHPLRGFEKTVAPVDAVIEEQSVRTAQRFLEEAEESKDEYIREQVASLNYMLFALTYDNPARYISTGEFMENLARYPNMLDNKKPFGRCVMGRMRDSGVLISSNGKGYKLVANQKDLEQFVKYYDSFIGPMLKRLRTCRNKIRLVTQNELDILDSPKYQYLKSFFDHEVTSE